MPTTLTRGATVLTFLQTPAWVDEFDFRAVEANARYSIAGALITDRGLKLDGRPMTLQGGQTLAAVNTLISWAALPDETFTLNYRGVTYAVRFNHTVQTVQATPLWEVADPAAGDFYNVTLRFTLEA